MKVLDLFSGIGGFSLGLEAAGMQTAAFCEFDDRARQVLRKNWPTTPIFEDVRTLNKELLDEQGVKDIRLICGGYPCQPFSLAGKRGGSEDDRHLWPEMFRLIQELRPSWVVGENVFGHISMGLDQVLADLEAADYSARSFVIPACAVDAPHRRDRIWTIARKNFLADPNARHSQQNEHLRSGRNAVELRSQTLGYSTSISWDGVQDERGQEKPETLGRETTIEFRGPNVRIDGRSSRFRKWKPEPSVGRVADGVPNRSHRLKQLGNAVVPQVVQAIGEMIMQVEREQAA